jgi:hypothetical protein
MLWFMRLTALVMLLGLSLPLLAEDAKKPDAEKKADNPKADDKDKLLPAGTLQGKITKFDADKRTMTVQVTYFYQKPHPDEYKALVDAQNRYNQAIFKRDRNGAIQAQNDMATHYAKLYSVEKKTQDLDLQITDEAKIRMASPPIAFDDDGKPKKYTKKELDELKGPDKKLPGYTAEFDAVATGELVQVQLVRKKDAKPPMNPNPGVPKPKDIVGEDALADHLPLVSVILIAQQGENK